MSTAVAMAAGAATLAAPTASAQPDYAPDQVAVSMVGPALVRVQASGPSGTTATCSGFLVHHEGYVVTSGRCVDPEGAGPRAVTVVVCEGTDDHAPRPAEVLEATTAEGDDLALLKVSGERLPVVPVATADPTESAAAVVAGLPARLPVVTRGSDASYFDSTLEVARPGPGPDGGPAFRLPTGVEEGMLGGPALEYGATVIGVSSAVTTGDRMASTTLTPASRVQALLARHGVANDPGPMGGAFQDGVRRLYRKDYEGSAERFAEALGLNPHVPTAVFAHALALQKAAEESDDGVSAPLVAAAAALALAAAAAAVAVTLRRRSRRRTTVVPSVDLGEVG